MPDYNPDKEGHVGHKWIVQNATRAPMKGVDVGGKDMPFNKDGRLLVNSPGVANDLRQKYGKRVTVTRMRYPDAHDRGHRYFFGGWPEMPWKRGKDGETKDEEKEAATAADDAGERDADAPQEEAEGKRQVHAAVVHAAVGE